MNNRTTFQGDGKIAYIPVIVNSKQTRQTNADKIRAMTDEELAVFLHGLVNEFGSMNHDCLDFNYCIIHSGESRYNGWLDWLKQGCE